MAEPRRRVFGPFFYSALVVCGLAATYSGVELVSPEVERWLAERRVRQALQAEDSAVRLRAIRQLDRASIIPYRAEFIARLKDPVVDVRLAACRALAIRGLDSPLVVPVLAAAAGEPRDEVRDEVAQILGVVEAIGARNPPPGADPAAAVEAQAILFRLLKDQRSDVRAAAANALGKARPDEALRNRLADEAVDEDREVRLAIAGSLLKLGGRGDPKAAEILCALVADPEPIGDRRAALKLAMDASPEIQGRVGDALLSLLTVRDPMLVFEIVSCVGEGFPPWEVARPALAKLLDHPDTHVRSAVATTMARPHSTLEPPVLAALVRVAADRGAFQDVRLQAIARLQEAAPTALAGVTPDLILQLSDPNQAIRLTAMELLGQIVPDQPARLPAAAPKE